VLIVFAYTVEEAERGRFERVYGRDGEWAAFFRADPGYVGTELHRDAEDRYLLVDRWVSRAAYEGFLARHRDDYDRRSRAAEGLYRSETLVGRFEPTAPAAGLTLELLAGEYAACRLDPGAPVPAWTRDEAFCSVTRTADELSILCPAAVVPEGIVAERGWRPLRVRGPLDFGLTGVAAALATPLAAAGVTVLLIATYDTDYLLVREVALERGVDAHRLEHRLDLEADDPVQARPRQDAELEHRRRELARVGPVARPALELTVQGGGPASGDLRRPSQGGTTPQGRRGAGRLPSLTRLRDPE
jgi:heme-degrading monooxygenase HmoA